MTIERDSGGSMPHAWISFMRTSGRNSWDSVLDQYGNNIIFLSARSFMKSLYTATAKLEFTTPVSVPRFRNYIWLRSVVAFVQKTFNIKPHRMLSCYS